MVLITKAFWLSAVENCLQTIGATFAGSGVFTNGQVTLKGLAAGGIAAGMAALYTFVKQMGANQTISAINSLASGSK